MSKRRSSGNEIVDLTSELQGAKARYLRSHGWLYTSDTPGCIWLWTKQCNGPRNDRTFEGRIILVDESTALAMQLHSCAIRGNEW